MRKRPFTANEVRKIERYLKGYGTPNSIRDYAIFRVALESSLRVVDLLDLKYGQVVFKSRVRRNFQTMQKKTKAPAKVVLGKKAVSALENHLSNRNDWNRDSYIFTGQKKTGRPITAVHWRRLLKGYCEEIGIDPLDISSHSTRKTFPTLAYKESGNLRICQEMLGHRSMKHVEHYLGVTEAEVEEVREKIYV